MKKRVLSFLAVAAMVLSMTPVISLPAAATTTADVDAWIAANDAAFDAGENLPSTCPCCDTQNVVWTAVSGTTSSQKEVSADTHFYLAGNFTSRTGGNVFDVKNTTNTVCLYLNGYKVESTNASGGRIVRARSSTFNIFGDGQVCNTASETSTATMFDFADGGALNVYGGTYTHNVSGAGMFEEQDNTSVTLYGGTFNVDASTQSNVTLAEGLSLKANGDGTFTVAEPVCPGCGAKNVTWEDYAGQHVNEETALTAAAGHKHYRLAADYKYDGYGFYMTDGTACFDLGAYSFTRQRNTGAAFYNGSGTLTITGTGLVKGSSVAAVQLGSGAATVNLKGGTFTKHITETGGYRTPPIVNLEAGGTVNMYDGAVLNADGCYNVQFSCVSMIGDADNKATFNLYGGEIVADDPANGTEGLGRDGTNYPGGAINVGRPAFPGNAELNVYGGEIWGGTLTHEAAMGGAIYVAPNNKVTVSGNAVIKGGNAPLGGNIYLADGATLELSGNAQIIGGVATKNGGNVYAQNATINMAGGSILDGTATIRGGNVYLAASDMNMSGGLVAGGNKNDQGVEANITLRPVDTEGSTLKMTGGTIRSEDAPTNVGSAVTIRNYGQLILGGTAQIITENGSNANAVKLVFASNGAADQILIDAGWTGKAHIHDGSSYSSGMALACGKWGSFDAEGNFVAGGEIPFTGDLHLMGTVVRGDAQGNLVVANVTVVDGETETWYADGDMAVKAYNALGKTNAYIRAKASGVELDITGDTYVDSNGFGVVVTGNGTLYGMDTTVDDYATSGGSFLVADTVTVVRDVTNGNRYIALKHGTDPETGYQILKAHRLDMKLSAVTLRAGKTSEGMGLYYKATLSMSEVLANRIETYGVVLSLANMPGADFMTDRNPQGVNENGFTALQDVLPVNAQNGYTVTINSGSVFGIMKADAAMADANAIRGEMPIYANAYLYIDFNGDDKFDADEFLMSDADEDTTNDVAWSLFDVMDAIDNRWSDFAAAQEKVTSFYSFWSDYGMNKWTFDNIKKA